MPCFRRLARLLEIEKNDDDYQKRAFTSEGKLMAVRLEQDWLADDWQFFIGVQSEASDKTVDDLLSEKGLGLKVANRDDVDRVYIKGRRGVSWSLVGQPPRSFPRENYHYFQVARDSSAWDDVIESLNLGLRFNEDLVENNQQGDNRLEAREQTSVEVVSMQFWLFAIRNS
jgi:predicted component of type VI protein secretion system